ncbi:hypothetical protein JCM8097_007296 [Rhodosporidiobolus ruineniae]
MSAIDTIKTALGSEGSTQPSQYQQGYQPNAEKEKAGQGGEGSRPPGKQYGMYETASELDVFGLDGLRGSERKRGGKRADKLDDDGTEGA